MKLSDQRGQHVGILQSEVVSRAVEVGGHQGDGVEPVLALVSLAHLDAGDFRDGVPLVGRLERAGKQAVLVQRLRCVLRVDAAGTQKRQLAGAVAVGGVDDVVLHDEVFADEIGGVAVVGVNAADTGGREDHHIRPVGTEPGLDLSLPRQLQFAPFGQQQLLVAQCAQAPHYGRAHQAAMPGDVDARLFIHDGKRS